jgi:hypothetical protein
MRYDPADGNAAVEGVRALARALEHIHLGWALLAAVMRLPVMWRVAQFLADASGAGPRAIPAWEKTPQREDGSR